MGKIKGTSIYFNRETLQFVGVDEAVKKQLSESYKGVNVDAELSKMALWLSSPKGKKRRGNLGFIMNWLNNACLAEMPPIREQFDLIEVDNPLQPHFQKYLKDLWKNREHILEFNTIKRQR